MSEEVAQAAGDIVYWRERALDAERDVANLERAMLALQDDHRRALAQLGQAEADAGTLRAALLRCYDAWKPPVPDWLIEAATGQIGQQAMQEVSAALAERAELDAARAFIREIRGAMLICGWRDEQSRLLAAYDAARKARSE